jgi:hypothetical protein
MSPPDSAQSLHLGAIGNGSASALVDAHGAIVWSCWPRFDGDPVFHALLGHPRGSADSAGRFAIELLGMVSAEQRYEPNTAVLRTTLADAQGNVLEITDFAPRFMSRGRMFHPLQLVRRLRVLAGAPRVRVLLCAALRLGPHRAAHHPGQPPRALRRPRPGAAAHDIGTHRLCAGWPALRAGRAHELLLGPDESLSEGIEELAEAWERETLAYWREWTRRLALPLQWQDAVIRAAITLKLCVHEDTGAIVAALTTSIPEAPGTQRNWDYRYCWLRDAFFVVRALNSLSEVGTMEGYLRWLTNIVADCAGRPGHVQPLYGIAWSARSPSTRCPSCQATAATGRCGVATRPTNTSSTMSTATSCSGPPRPSTTAGCCARPDWRSSRCSSRWARRPCACTTSPTRACGSCARASACTPPRC